MKPNDVLFICDFETTGIGPDDYPIELGGIFTDCNFKALDFFDELIFWKYLGTDDWNDEYKEAYKMHKIDFDYWIKNSVPRNVAIEILEDKINRLKNKKYNRFIIVSDNAQFEYNHMKKLYGDFGFPFHYTAWDVNLLFALNNIEEDDDAAHRAFSDAMGIYFTLIKNFKK